MPRNNLVLIVKVDSSYGSAKLHATIAYRDTGPESVKLRSPLFEQYGDGERYAAFADLEVTAWLDRDGSVNDGQPYGFRYSYSPHMVELAQAQLMVKTLRKIGRGMEKLSAEHGHASDFATYLTRFAIVLGIREYAEHSREMRPDGSHWRWMDADGMRRWVAKQTPRATE